MGDPWKPAQSSGPGPGSGAKYQWEDPDAVSAQLPGPSEAPRLPGRGGWAGPGTRHRARSFLMIDACFEVIFSLPFTKILICCREFA